MWQSIYGVDQISMETKDWFEIVCRKYNRDNTLNEILMRRIKLPQLFKSSL